MVNAVADQVFIPLTVGGGVDSVDDVRALLNAGADKVSINTAGIRNPDLIGEAAARFGAQCIVAAIDAKKCAVDQWQVYIHGGRTPTGIDVVAWATEATEQGAGEASPLLVLWLEDLHWSDAATLDLLAALARRREPARLLIVGTYRPAEALASGHPLGAVQRELHGHGLCTELPLGWLSEAAVAEYVRWCFTINGARPASLQRRSPSGSRMLAETNSTPCSPRNSLAAPHDAQAGCQKRVGGSRIAPSLARAGPGA